MICPVDSFISGRPPGAVDGMARLYDRFLSGVKESVDNQPVETRAD